MRSRSDGPTLAADYLNALEHQRRLSPATLRNYAHALHALLGFHDDLKTLEPAQVRRFVAMLHAKGQSPRTLALMHGPSFAGDGAAALCALADDYDRRVSSRVFTDVGRPAA